MELANGGMAKYRDKGKDNSQTGHNKHALWRYLDPSNGVMELIVSRFCLWRALSCVLYCSVWVKFRSGDHWRLWDTQDVLPSLNVTVSSFLFPIISPCLYPSAWSSFLHLSLYSFLPSLLGHLCPYFHSFWYPVMADFVQDLCNLLTIRWGTNPVLEKK